MTPLSRTVITAISLVLTLKTSTAAWSALDPEETLYVYTTCFDEWAPAPKNAKARKETAQIWFKEWNITPNEQSTHCFVKCVLENIGLYDAETNTFAVTRIKDQSQAYQSFTQLEDKKVQDFIDDLTKLKPTLKWKEGCSDLYNAYAPVYNTHKSAFRALFHAKKEITDKIYNEMKSRLKQREETYVNFCESKYFPKREKNIRLCNVRGFNLNVKPDNDLKNHIDCIFKGFRYVSKDGRFYATKLLRDFHKIGLNSSAFDKHIEDILKKCKDTSAYGYYICLLRSDQAASFKVALNYREIRSGNYKSVILGDKFEWGKIAKQQKEIASKICPTSNELEDMLKYTKDDYFTLGESLILTD